MFQNCDRLPELSSGVSSWNTWRSAADQLAGRRGEPESPHAFAPERRGINAATGITEVAEDQLSPAEPNSEFGSKIVRAVAMVWPSLANSVSRRFSTRFPLRSPRISLSSGIYFGIAEHEDWLR